MTGKAIRHLLYILLTIAGVVRRGKCEFEMTENDDYLNEYLVFDENKYFAELQEFDDTTLEIDLMNRNRKHRPTHEEPRVLYQVGVSHLYQRLLCFSSLKII